MGEALTDRTVQQNIIAIFTLQMGLLYVAQMVSIIYYLINYSRCICDMVIDSASIFLLDSGSVLTVRYIFLYDVAFI